jgi:hypothetical protein
MKYSTLASKAMDAVTEELDGQITDALISSTYDDKKQDFDVIDFSFYSFRVDYEEVAKETLGEDFETLMENNEDNQNKVLEAYKAAVEKAKADAEALAELTDAEAFKKAVLAVVADESYADAYKTQKVADVKGELSDDELAELRSAMIAESLAAAMGEKTENSITIEEDAETGTAYGKTVSAAMIEALEKVKAELDGDLSSALTSYVIDKATYTKDDDFSEWAFAADRAEGDTKVLMQGDGEDEELGTEKGYTYANVYYLRALPHADTEKTRDVEYALFSTEDKAKAAIEALKDLDTIDHEAFEKAVGDNGSTGHADVEDCYEGRIGSTTFDAWLFDEETEVGEFTPTALKLDDSTWCVARYTGEGEETWKVTVHSSILSEKFEAYYDAMEEKYAITVKEGALKAIKA